MADIAPQVQYAKPGKPGPSIKVTRRPMPLAAIGSLGRGVQMPAKAPMSASGTLIGKLLAEIGGRK